MSKVLLLLFLILGICEESHGAKILAIIPSPFFSHQSTFRPLWLELAKRGHKITLITTDLMDENENITQIDYSGTYEIFKKHRINQFLADGYSITSLITKIFETVDDLVDYQLAHPGLVSLIKNKEKFDVILVENMIPVYFVLSAIFECPYIGITSMDAPPDVHSFVGNAMHPAVYPFYDFGFPQILSFKERLFSTSYVWFNHLFNVFILQPLGDKVIRKYFGEGLPRMIDSQRNASLLFINADPIFVPARPSTPITINLEGGLHLREPRKLPRDLQTYLDGAKHGCVYFSFGSNVNSNFLSEEVKEIFRKTFEELAPIKVLWKFENDTMPLKPKNLELKKWLPQQDVLRHPNVKVFITQGGLQSMEEAIDSAVPMMGMPFYGYQINNVKKMVEKEFGLRLDINTLDSTSLKNSILELLNNPKYKKNIDKLSAISKDQPMRPLEKAVWWTEYVLRHKTTEHLRSPSADIPLYQYFFLDILAFLLVVFIFTILSFYYCFKLTLWTFRAIFCKKNKVKIN